MACVPSDLKYSGNHEWVRPLGNGRVRMGITEYAQKKLGDPVYVQLPAAGSRWDAGDNFGYVESVKSINDLYLPVAGTIAAVNESLQESHFGAEHIANDSYGDGWIAEVTLANPTDLKGLLTPTDYEKLINQQGWRLSRNR
ncbi:glycine cleavage system protein GcvH [Streptomyces sp. NPDC059597]|uniref:glycine cleavage system protein GcvH n=1 Tax=Streptomyces sp. NPDC059597 TaxID=3346879 RepID=UPI0036CCD1AA